MTFKTLKIENRNSISIITIDREEKLNALSDQVLSELKQLLTFLGNYKIEAIRGVILTGAGSKAFAAGADIQPMLNMSARQGKELGQRGQEVANLLENLPIPVIACVDGYALGGGCEIAMACDFIYATEKSFFGQPEVKLGLIPGFGGCIRLTRLVGAARAKEIIYTGRLIGAQRAEKIGLVNSIFKTKTDVIDAALKTFTEMDSHSSNAIAVSKRVINQAINQSEEEAMVSENQGYFDVFNHKHSKEGIGAFLEKRKPEF